MLFCFFRFLIHVILSFVKCFIKKLSFLIQISKIHFKPCDTKTATLWIRGKIWKKPLLFRFEIIMYFWHIFQKDCTKKVLKIFKPIVIENLKLVPLCSINGFKVGLSPSKKKVFICFNDSPSKMMKNPFRSQDN